MKIRTLLFLAFCFAHSLVAQTDSLNTTEDKTYEMFDIQNPPKFPGGESAMLQYISQNLQYPAAARESGIEGTVVITFVVGKDGSISNIKIVKDIGGGCGKEAARVVAYMPKWSNGEANGHPVKVMYTLPVRFKLEGSKTTSPPKENTGPFSTDAMWKLVSEAAKNICKLKGTVARNTPFGTQPVEEKKLLSALELSSKAMLSEKDKAGFKDLGQVSDYFYQAQFAPTFYTVELYRGQQAKFLTNREDFDSNADGLGKIGSIKVPQGFQIILYSKKDFKGKKLKINALEGALEIPDLNAITPEKGKIKNGGNKVNWAVNTLSIKVIMPKEPIK